MISETRRIANHGNAQNSTGPTSAAGKAASRMNALKTGLYAKSLVIPGESREDFEELAQQFDEQYRPVSPQARVLVDILIRHTWLLRRFDRIESEQWDNSFRRIGTRHGDQSNSTSQAFELGGRAFDRIHKFAAASERSILRAIAKLDKLTEHVRVDEAPSTAPEAPPPNNQPALPPQPVDPEAASTGIGFVPPIDPSAALAAVITGRWPMVSSPEPASSSADSSERRSA